MDYVALGILLGLLIFSLVMFVIIRSQSKKSEHPDAQNPNYAEPTPLNHAPDGSQAEFSKSMLSLALTKNGSENESISRVVTPEPSTKDGSGGKLFFEDTGAAKVVEVGRRIEVV